MTFCCMEAAFVMPPIDFGAPLASRSASRLRYSAAASATRFSSMDKRRRSSSRLISGGMSSVSSKTWPSSLRPSVASDPAIGVNSRRSRAWGLGVRGAPVLLSKRLNASPNLPASNVFVPDREGKLDRLACLLPLLVRRSLRRAASWSSIVRRKSTFDSMLLSSSVLESSATAASAAFGSDDFCLPKKPGLEVVDSRSRR